MPSSRRWGAHARPSTPALAPPGEAPWSLTAVAALVGPAQTRDPALQAAFDQGVRDRWDGHPPVSPAVLCGQPLTRAGRRFWHAGWTAADRVLRLPVSLESVPRPADPAFRFRPARPRFRVPIRPRRWRRETLLAAVWAALPYVAQRDSDHPLVGFVTKEDLAVFLRARPDAVGWCLHRLNLAGVVSQPRHAAPPGTRRALFGSDCESMWQGDTYQVALDARPGSPAVSTTASAAPRRRGR